MEVWWLEQSTSEMPVDDGWMGPSEKLRFDAMRFPKRRTDWQLGRWTAKSAVAAYLNVPCGPSMLTRIEIRAAASGAPEVYLDTQPAEVSISITHRAGIAACAVAPSKMTIGCDLELIEPRSEAFLSDYFTAGEQALMMPGSVTERAISSTLLWSAKESALKVLKAGLRLDTRCVEVTLDEMRPAEGFRKNTICASIYDAPRHAGNWQPLAVTHENGQSFQGWWLRQGELVRTIVTAPSAEAPKIVARRDRSKDWPAAERR